MKEKHIIIITFILIPFLPIIFTSPTFTGVSFNNLGQIGDVIGGTTAPFVGLISIYFIYKAFKIQYQANKKLDSFNKDNFLIQDIEKLEEYRKNELTELKEAIVQETTNTAARIIPDNDEENLLTETKEINELFNLINKSGYLFLILTQYHKMLDENQKTFTPGEVRMEVYLASVLRPQLVELLRKFIPFLAIIKIREEQSSDEILKSKYSNITRKIDDYINTITKIVTIE